MPFKDSKEGQTHSYNDGCGEPEHNDNETLGELVRDLTKVSPMPKSEARDRIMNFAKAYAEKLIGEHDNPYSADPTNPIKHVYQNEGYIRAKQEMRDKNNL